MIIRILDIIFSFIGLIILSPFFLIISLLIVLDSRGGIFYKQQRVGLNGVEFKLFKFRTMYTGADKKGLLTVGGKDNRITKIGYFLRKYKLDELPQLINVFIGEMSLVGPRPEVRKYTDMYNDYQKKVLSVKPGITDYASIEYSDENEILGKAINPEKAYIEEVMPAKIELNYKFINNPTTINYLKIILLTIYKIIK
jgi:lipopolysaccharide/colanic/teichoic acid biosynthesis glycosyltransferase